MSRSRKSQPLRLNESDPEGVGHCPRSDLVAELPEDVVHVCLNSAISPRQGLRVLLLSSIRVTMNQVQFRLPSALPPCRQVMACAEAGLQFRAAVRPSMMPRRFLVQDVQRAHRDLDGARGESQENRFDIE